MSMKKTIIVILLFMFVVLTGCSIEGNRTVSYVMPNGEIIPLDKADSDRYLEAYDNLEKTYANSDGLGIGGYFTFKISQKGKKDVFVYYAEDGILHINKKDNYYVDMYDPYFDIHRELWLKKEKAYYRETMALWFEVTVDSNEGISRVSSNEMGKVVFVNGEKTVSDVLNAYGIDSDDTSTINSVFEKNKGRNEINNEVIYQSMKIKLIGIYESNYYIIKMDD